MRGDIVGNVRDAGAVLPQPFVDVSPEVGRARAAHLAPYARQDGLVLFGVGRPAPPALPEPPAPGQQLVRVLARVAGRFAHIVENVPALVGFRYRIRTALCTYVFVRRHS